MRYDFFYKTVGSAVARGQYRVQCQYQMNRNRHCINSAITTLRDHSSWIFGDRHHIDFRTRRYIVFVLSARFPSRRVHPFRIYGGRKRFTSTILQYFRLLAFVVLQSVRDNIIDAHYET